MCLSSVDRSLCWEFLSGADRSPPTTLMQMNVILFWICGTDLPWHVKGSSSARAMLLHQVLRLRGYLLKNCNPLFKELMHQTIWGLVTYLLSAPGTVVAEQYDGYLFGLCVCVCVALFPRPMLSLLRSLIVAHSDWFFHLRSQVHFSPFSPSLSSQSLSLSLNTPVLLFPVIFILF